MFSNNIKHHIKNEVIGFDQHVVGSPPTPPIKPSRLSNSGIPVFVITDNQEVFLCPVCNIEILKSNLNWHIQTMHQVEVQTKILDYNDPDVQEAEENDLKSYNIAGKDLKFNKTRPPAMNGGYINNVGGYKGVRIACKICQKEIDQKSMARHLRDQHGPYKQRSANGFTGYRLPCQVCHKEIDSRSLARHLRDQHGQGTQNKQLNYDLKNQNDSEVLTSKHPTTTTATINCPNCNINIDQNFLPKHVRYCTLQDMRSTSELTEKSTKLNENIDEGGKFKFESQSPSAIELSMPEVGEEINIQICTQLLDKSTTIVNELEKPKNTLDEKENSNFLTAEEKTQIIKRKNEEFISEISKEHPEGINEIDKLKLLNSKLMKELSKSVEEKGELKAEIALLKDENGKIKNEKDEFKEKLENFKKMVNNL